MIKKVKTTVPRTYIFSYIPLVKKVFKHSKQRVAEGKQKRIESWKKSQEKK